ncbi:unnamed protein product [Calicophoron daubneyi]|uniref:Receptor protein-tyrosine kinase n=1 Tax=Calicophoron daubneyi TaxID=300641 RepID=A0AAV2T8W1_CALDB
MSSIPSSHKLLTTVFFLLLYREAIPVSHDVSRVIITNGDVAMTSAPAFTPVITRTTKTTMTREANTDVVFQIQAGLLDQNLNVIETATRVQLICLHGKRWTVPDTFPYSENGPNVMLEHSRDLGSTLTLRLPKNMTERAKLRGLYECSQVSQQISPSSNETAGANGRQVGEILKWRKRRNQPSCCPCCPWYEQEQCVYSPPQLYSGSVRAKSDLLIGSVFLFTAAVDLQSVQLHVVPGEPMLIPCSAPLDQHPHRVLTIDSQFLPQSTFSMPWFPFYKHHGDDIQHYYDPRYGLCLTRSQFPRSMLHLVCKYHGNNRRRVIQIIWPPTPPTISPFVHIQILNPKQPSETQPDNYHQYENILLSRTSENPLIFRVHKGSVVRVQCIAAYTQHRIVIQPPPRLCFQWNWTELSESQSANWSTKSFHSSPKLSRNDTETEEHWKLTGCPITELIASPTRKVIAANEIDLPPLRHNTSVGCRVLTPTRRAPSRQQFIILVPTMNDQSEAELQWFVQPTDQTKFWNYSLEKARLFIFVDRGQTVARTYFWSDHEVNLIPLCTANIRNDTYRKTVMRRVGDKWECQLIADDKALTNSGKLIFGYKANSHSVEFSIMNRLLLTKPELRGLHGNATVPQNISCVRSSRESVLDNLLGINGLVSFSWEVTLDNETRVYNSDELKTNNYLYLPPVIDDLSDHTFSFTTNGDRSISVIPVGNQSIPYEGPRQLCVRCTSTYVVGIRSEGRRVCVRYGGAGLGQRNSIQHTKEGSQDSIIFFSFNHPLNSTLDGSRVRVTNETTIVEGSPLEISCSLARGIPLTTPLPLRASLWPSIHFGSGKNTSGSSEQTGIKKTWILTPYNREVLLSFQHVRRTMFTGGVTCVFENVSATLPLNVVLPVSPRIIEPKEPVRLFMEMNAIHLICRAEGIPIPTIMWEELHTYSDLNGTEREAWRIMGVCNSSDADFTLSTVRTCEHEVRPNKSTDLIRMRCSAINTAGMRRVNVTLSRVDIDVITNESVGQLKQTRIAIGVGFFIVLLVVVISSITVFLHCRTVQALKNGSFRKIENQLYKKANPHIYCRRDDTSAEQCILTQEQQYVVQALAMVFGSTEHVYRWIIPREWVEGSCTRLGLGHYGQVVKAWLSQTHLPPAIADKQQPSDERIPIAVKTASGEMSSLTCLRNEMSLLPFMGDGSNIVKMIGLILGSKEDLSDTCLVLEYCEYGSLNEFIRKYAASILNADRRTQKGSTHSYDSGVYSTNGTDGATDTFGRHGLGGVGGRISESSMGFHNPGENMCGTDSHSPQGETGRGHSVTTDYRLTIRQLYEIAHGIAKGLNYLASNTVIHRDLATRNILIDNNITPKICDFGLAVKLSQNEEVTGSGESYRIVTFRKQLPFRILPPEALRYQTFYLASDIWEYGLLLWELFHLETRKPFGCVDSAEELMRLIQEHRIRLISSPYSTPSTLERPALVHDDLWSLMCQSWQVDHKRRPNAADFENLLESLLNAANLPFQVTGPQHQTLEPRREILHYLSCGDFKSEHSGCQPLVEKSHNYINTVEAEA